MTSRVITVADDPLSASALRTALKAAATLDVVDGYVAAGSRCTAVMLEQRPDVVVVDQLASRDDAVACIRETRTALAAVKIIVLIDSSEAAWLSVAVAAGADAAIVKTFRLEKLGILVREVAAGNVFHAFQFPASMSRRASTPELSKLTDRELEILRLAAGGAPNGRIAAQLWITEQTVKFHLSNVYRKLGVSNRTQAGHLAYVHGLLESTTRDIAA